MTIQDQIAALPDPEFHELRQWMQDQARAREARPLVDAGQAEIITELREAGTVTGPDAASTPEGSVPAWVDPGTIHTAMYVLGDHVSHGGRVWRSEHQGLNHWEPGGVGIDERIWRDVTPTETQDDPEPVPEDPEVPQEPATPAWQVGVNYTIGDRVIFEGTVYEVIQAHTSASHWPPNAVASLYKAV